MASQEQTQRSILIIGAGCFGLATAYSLASAGYTDITVLEKDDFVPSLFSAANDLNKVIRAEYADTFYTDIALVEPARPVHLSYAGLTKGTERNPKMADGSPVHAALPPDWFSERHLRCRRKTGHGRH